MTDIPQPSQSTSPAYGQMERCRLGGGDTLYGLRQQDALQAIAQSDQLVLHHTLQNRQDARQHLLVELSLYGIALLLANLFFTGIVSNLFHMDRDDRVALLLYLGLPASLVIFVWLWLKYRRDHPNYGWESLKTMDFPKRQLCCYAALFGKEADQTTNLYAFEDLGLVCYVNNYWEQGPSIDLALAKRTDIKAAKYPSECRFFCHLYSVNPPSVETRYGKHTVTDQIPDELMGVAQALIERSGITFFDFVSKPDPQSKAKARKAARMVQSAQATSRARPAKRSGKK